jgi:hypothetical protein
MTARLSSGVKGCPAGIGELSLCLQAGGVSSRMGTDKALKSFCGEPLIERVLRRLLAKVTSRQRYYYRKGCIRRPIHGIDDFGLPDYRRGGERPALCRW